MDIRLLGPLTVRSGPTSTVGLSGRLRSLLSVIALDVGEPVSVDTLADRIWGEDLPQSPRRSIQTLVTRLRYALGSTTVRTTTDGYVLDLDPGQVDLVRFRTHLGIAAATEDLRVERAHLCEALGLWRGEPFGGTSSHWLHHQIAPALQERYLAARERRIDVDIGAGRQSELVAELREFVAEHPLRETAWMRYLAVLHQCGRRAEAIDGYATVRRLLNEELGVEPGLALQRLHLTLLRDATRQPA